MTTPITVQSAGFSSALPLDPDDLLAIAAAGYRANACNRPHGEGGIGPPASQKIAAAARPSCHAFADLPVVAASLLRRRHLKGALIDQSASHHDQPAWTRVGGGDFDPALRVRPMASLIPSGAAGLHAEAAALAPMQRQVTIGKNGVTSNDRSDLVPSTGEPVQRLQRGKTLLSQPPMPIKCAGAQQNALPPSADHWMHRGRLEDIEIAFYPDRPVWFGVAAFVPPLRRYVERHDAQRVFNTTLGKVDPPSRRAWFGVQPPHGAVRRGPRGFDMLHAAPPQVLSELVRMSPLSEAAGGCEVDLAIATGPAPSGSLFTGRRVLRTQRQDRRCGVQAARGHGGEPSGASRRQAEMPLRRLRRLPADGSAWPGAAGRVRLQRQAAADLSARPDGRPCLCLVAQGARAALGLLAPGAVGQRVADPRRAGLNGRAHYFATNDTPCCSEHSSASPSDSCSA